MVAHIERYSDQISAGGLAVMNKVQDFPQSLQKKQKWYLRIGTTTFLTHYS